MSSLEATASSCLTCPNVKGVQERPQRRRRPDPVKQPAHRAVPQQGHVIDAVRTGDHARDQRRDLQRRVGAASLADPDVLSDKVLQPGPFGDLQDRCQTSARHEVGSSNTPV